MIPAAEFQGVFKHLESVSTELVKELKETRCEPRTRDSTGPDLGKKLPWFPPVTTPQAEHSSVPNPPSPRE